MPTVAPWKAPESLSPAIWYDLFPTTVTFPATNKVHDKSRIIVTAPSPTDGPRLYVFTDGPQGPIPVIIAEIDPDLIFGDTTSGFDFVLTRPNPTPVHIQTRPMHNCGCGSALEILPSVQRPPPHRSSNPPRPPHRLRIPPRRPAAVSPARPHTPRLHRRCRCGPQSHQTPDRGHHRPAASRPHLAPASSDRHPSLHAGLYGPMPLLRVNLGCRSRHAHPHPRLPFHTPTGLPAGNC